MEAESRSWMVQCPNCKYEQSYWDMGGIRWGALGRVFIGTPATGPGTLVGADNLQLAGNLSNFYLGGHFKDAGFNEAYQDGENQVGHVWGFIANTTILHGTFYDKHAADIETILANNGHEFTEIGTGGSIQDFMLSRAGMKIGNQITNGLIAPDDLDDVLITNLGKEIEVNTGFVWQSWFLPDAQARP